MKCIGGIDGSIDGWARGPSEEGQAITVIGTSLKPTVDQEKQG
jgi:hypothetical protein